MAAGRTRAWWSRLAAQPTRAAVLALALFVALGAALLMLPAATAPGRSTSVLTALFTSTGAATGGIAIVGTGSHWSAFGEGVVLALIQVGGFGIMTLASLLGLLVAGRLRLSTQFSTQAETGSFGVADLRRVVLRIAGTTLVIEFALAAILTTRFRFGYGQSAGEALHHGVFYAISAFNNAGFALRDDNLVGYAHDGWIVLPIAAGCLLGALGFPVLLELLRVGRAGVSRRIRHRWSLHTRLTLATYAVLLVVGTHRRIPEAALRQALTVALLGVALVMSGTLALLTTTDEAPEAVLFESVSAFGAVGLSTGITGGLPAVGQLTLIALMFTGRLGPITLASALALRERDRRYTLPEERPVIG
ncbi:potassium transporter TrkG [Streptomyces himalayensis]|uniref:TrkH family potassium uptake protein n=1 Tax=Streptomyces himalayensis subsp. himalayensis TaxID=2756131 RepID=A0A7W0IA50_9ACTN|nr:potassium transporter TrkG [Streptomyces himalayensis]MBA2947988.1 hypothetical protein [Streptomyces himalayensis subsp. himalayensis]